MERIKRKINVIGKICRIIAMVFAVLMIVSTSGLVVTGIILTLVPNSALSAEAAGEAVVNVQGSWVDKIPQEQIDKLAEEIAKDAANIKLASGTVTGAEKKDGAVTLRVRGSWADFTLRRVGLALIAYAVVTGCLIYVSFALYRMMKEFEKCSTPFSDGVVKRMTRFAISLIPFAVLKPLFSRIPGQILFSGSISLDFDFDLTVVIGVLIIFMLTLIFKYGAALQKESDETL